MKKCLLFVLAAMMALSAVSALAEVIQLDEPIPGYEMTIVLPDGAEGEIETGNDWTWIRFINGPTFDLTIAPSEIFEGKDISDLSPEEKEMLALTLADNAANPQYAFITLENGMEVIVLEEETEENDFAVIQTMQNGHFISLYARYDNFAKLTAEDFDNMGTVMNGIILTKIEAAE